MKAELGEAYPLRLICRALQVALSSLCASRRPRKPRAERAKPGPKMPVSNEALAEAIRRVLRESPFHGVSYAYVGEPEGNGIVERFLRTLKEQVLWVHRFRNLEQARQVIGEFIARYNGEWLIQRLGYRSPAQARQSFRTLQEAA
jgi:transposase InsO family protein